MKSGDLYQFFEKELDELKQKDSLRSIKTIQRRQGKYVTYKNKKYLNLSSNDYLGLASDEKLHKKFYNRIEENIIDQYGLGSSSSRLLTGTCPLCIELEQELAGLYNDLLSDNNYKKEALLFNSGYHANVGIISSIVGKKDLLLSDRLNHASIIDGVRLSGADYIPYDHLDYNQLINILKEKRDKYSKAVIISESVFSMDGDIADIQKLVEIKNKFNTLLYIDEAHALGVFGDNGLGICEAEGVAEDVDIIMATFGKALASQGAYGIFNPVLKEYLINKMRTFIFTTSLPPVTVNWNLYNIKNISSLRDKRKKLLQVAEKLRLSLKEAGLRTGGKSQIVPVVIGDNENTILKSEKLQENGFLVFPIRPPSVPQGSSRMRISLTADIEWEDINKIAEIIRD